MKQGISRRALVKSSIFGLLTVSIPTIGYARSIRQIPEDVSSESVFHRYPSIDDEIVADVVGSSHFNLNRVKELVEVRAELARATWDWAFGDWETALGAASHVGRRDIAEYLMSKGARPDIFTFAMLGSFEAVKAMIEASPGIQSIDGPHGISLLQHAKNGARDKSLTVGQKAASEQLIRYLEQLGNADNQVSSIEMTEEEKNKYLGDYRYGEGESEGLSIKLNMRKMISLGKLGKFGGALIQSAPNKFIYNGISSIYVSFEQRNDKIISLTIHEPDLTLTARKVS